MSAAIWSRVSVWPVGSDKPPKVNSPKRASKSSAEAVVDERQARRAVQIAIFRIAKHPCLEKKGGPWVRAGEF